MKTNKILKVVGVIILIIILMLISFVGIYVKENGRLVNVHKAITKGFELGVEKEYVFSVSEATTTEYYDKEGNLVPEEEVDQEAEEGTYTTKEVKENPDEVKTAENYALTKEIMKQRIKDIALDEYRITINEENGDVVLKTNELSEKDNILYAICGQGEFILKDAETKEILLDNKDIKEVLVGYYAEETGTSVYLTIQLNKEGEEKLKNISSTYIQTAETKDVTAEDGTVTQEETTVEKNVELYIDGTLVVNTYFGEPIENGQLQLSMGSGITDTEELQNTLVAASVEATKLTYGPLPLVYEVVQSANILSNYDMAKISEWEAIGIVLIAFVLIGYVVRFKERAMISSILFLGYTAIYLLIIRYANVPITAASIIGFTFVELFVIVFIDKMLRKIKRTDKNDEVQETPKSVLNKCILQSIYVLVPALIIAIVFSMYTSLAISSLGIMLFWGILLFAVYSYVFGKTLLLNFEYLFENK